MVDHEKNEQPYEVFLRYIEAIPDYPNRFYHSEIKQKIYPEALLRSTHTDTSQYYHQGFSLYNNKRPAEYGPEEIKEIMENNRRLLQRAKTSLDRCLTDKRAEVFLVRAKQQHLLEPDPVLSSHHAFRHGLRMDFKENFAEYDKFQNEVRSGLCPLYKVLQNKAWEMEDIISENAPLCAEESDKSVGPCQAMDTAVETFNLVWNTSFIYIPQNNLHRKPNNEPPVSPAPWVSLEEKAGLLFGGAPPPSSTSQGDYREGLLRIFPTAGLHQ